METETGRAARIMKRWLSSAFLLLAALSFTATAARAQTLESLAREAKIPILSLKILSEIPHDTSCWTQGLVYEDGILYESVGEYGKSKVLKLDAATGEVLQQIALADRYFAEGLTVLGDELYLVTWLENTAFVLDKQTLEIRRTMTYYTDGWGLTTIGQTLIMSDGSNRLFFRNPEDFEQEWVVTAAFGSRFLHNLNELEYDGKYLWANVLGTDNIARIKAGDGNVSGIVDATPLRARVGGDMVSSPMNGIAFDPKTGDYFLTGKKWPAIFRVRIVQDED